MPNSVSSGLPNPASYTDLGNGTVRDNVTCLVWQKALDTPTAASMGVTMPGTITDNMSYCSALATASYGGQTDWRIPTRVELASVLDFTRTGSALSPPLTGTNGYDRTFSLWYETIALIGSPPSTFGWVYNLTSFSDSGFTSNAYAQASVASARCVSGNGTGEGLMQQAVEPANHYTIAAGEVTDNYTGLVWQQVYSTSVMTWSAAAGYCSGLGLNGHTWRVPSIKEMSTLVNEALVGPAVDRTAFPNTVFCGDTTWFWGAEADANLAGSAWGINFCDGYTGANNTASFDMFTTGYVRCVR
ncbi:MAG TPA: DUF1566 domain-containing protein [Polyangiaceae bacterium]|jgi:hypothetical protein